MPGMKDGKWDYVVTSGRPIDRNKFEDFKTRFYRFQGWDADSGFPTRDTLESQGLGPVAEELQQHGKLGSRST
jgi:aldehyde:ferredoxin oxidoreductase